EPLALARPADPADDGGDGALRQGRRGSATAPCAAASAAAMAARAPPGAGSHGNRRRSIRVMNEAAVNWWQPQAAAAADRTGITPRRSGQRARPTLSIPALDGSNAAFNALVAFTFFLLATIITTPARLRTLAWSLTICAIPLAATGIWHYLSGDVMKTTQDGLVRVVGYQGSSGLTGNPNDLALMLNLIIPLSGALA